MINVDRNVVAAPSVVNNYRTPEILAALGIVFLDKCYLCEKKLPHANFFQVDHFIPKNEDPDLEFEWSNLYLCCIECNGTRTKSTPAGGYLDPCNIVDDVEDEIVYSLPAYEYNEPLFTPRLVDPSDKTKNAIIQLKRMHYGGTAVAKIKCAAFREVISKRATKLISKIAEEKKAIIEGNNILANQRAQEIENMIKNDAPFTMLMRNLVERMR